MLRERGGGVRRVARGENVMRLLLHSRHSLRTRPLEGARDTHTHTHTHTSTHYVIKRFRGVNVSPLGLDLLRNLLNSISPASARRWVEDHACVVGRQRSGASAAGGRRVTGAVCRAAQAARVSGRQRVHGEDGFFPRAATGHDSPVALFRRWAAGAA